MSFRVTCLCAQFESVLQHGLKRTRGLALTAAAIKQVTGFSSKTEMESIFWYYVKEVLNKHELQRFYSLRNITTDTGRGRAWLRCALNEHSLERYLHMLLADKNHLSVFYEDWSFLMDEERSSMIPIMAAENLEDGNEHGRADFSVELTQSNAELHYRVETSSPVHKNALTELLPSDSMPETMTVAELRQAIVAMMNRKHELEEQNSSLRSLLEGEMEHSAGLRQEVDNLKKKASEHEEHHTVRIQALAR
ncbi:hypothetical protein Chor_015187 [Crotalus horridus]